MERSYIVETLPSHAGHPDSKVLLVHIWPTPDMPTCWVEWCHLGRLLSFARSGPQPGHPRPSINQYQSVYGNLARNWKWASAHIQYHRAWGCLGGPLWFARSELQPNQHAAEASDPVKQPSSEGGPSAFFTLAHRPRGMTAHECSTLAPQIWATALSYCYISTRSRFLVQPGNSSFTQNEGGGGAI